MDPFSPKCRAQFDLLVSKYKPLKHDNILPIEGIFM